LRDTRLPEKIAQQIKFALTKISNFIVPWKRSQVLTLEADFKVGKWLVICIIPEKKEGMPWFVTCYFWVSVNPVFSATVIEIKKNIGQAVQLHGREPYDFLQLTAVNF